MKIEPKENQSGLWTNPDWTPGTPGTFALLIGISTYDYFTGGKGSPLAANSYGLGQLAVSAWTAYGLFNWLRTSYQYATAPLAQCWLLLAPTEEEQIKIAQADSGGVDVLAHPLAPTFANQQEAIAQWSAVMATLPKAAAGNSRSLFFFSGHGLEIHLKEQILLPADYLRLPNTHNAALNIRRLADAMSALPVCDQFFFVDACRSAPYELTGFNIQGNGVLTIPPPNAVNATCNSAILYATATGMPAHQPVSPDKGVSLFGQALLDGLQSLAGFIPDCSHTPCAVQLAPLQRFVGQRYNQLLTLANWRTSQYVKLGSEPLDLYSTITYVNPSPILPTPLPSTVSLQQTAFTDRLDVQSGSEETPEGPLFRIDIDSNELIGSSHSEKATLLDILGRSSVTDLWSSARVYSLADRQWLPASELVLSRVERTELSVGYRLTFTLKKPQARYWLELTDERMVFCILLPGNESGGAEPSLPYYQLDFTLYDIDETVPPVITSLQANLSLSSTGELTQIAAIWEKYQTVDIATAVESVDTSFLFTALRQKRIAPLGALISAMVLLQARRFDLAKGEWLTNLMNWFPHLPDSLLLRNQWLMQTRLPQSTDELVTNLVTLGRRGSPFTGECFSLALIQLDRLMTDYTLTPTQQAEIDLLNQRFRFALRYFQPGGLLAVFASEPNTFTPALLGYA